ncbi:MAG: hypothetical protein LBJ38_01210 [Oscillospiraceae bacterium]|jgi:hypothetical protein|nr:hypothetical protein [Oscillospiraceae bacterium]
MTIFVVPFDGSVFQIPAAASHQQADSIWDDVLYMHKKDCTGAAYLAGLSDADLRFKKNNGDCIYGCESEIAITAVCKMLLLDLVRHRKFKEIKLPYEIAAIGKNTIIQGFVKIFQKTVPVVTAKGRPCFQIMNHIQAYPTWKDFLKAKSISSF